MKRKRGVTFIELIMAIIVVSISVLSVALIYQQVLKDSVSARVLTVATSLAEEKMEEKFGLGYSGVSVGTEGPFRFNNSSGSPFYEYRYLINVTYVNETDPNVESATPTGYKRITVSVVHSQIGNVTVRTLVTNYTQ